MKTTLIAATVVLASFNLAQARSWSHGAVVPPVYDYSREKKPGYVKDYCEDSVGNHYICGNGAQTGGPNARYQSDYQQKAK